MLLFVDEIHRWNRSQQDALLPHVESGLIILVGATTENPSFSINPALRSRCWVIELKSLDIPDIITALQRGLNLLNISAEPDVLEQIANMSSGDVRRAISILERLAPTAENKELSMEIIQSADLQKDLL